MGILDKAKEKASELKEQAANKATELKEQAASKATELKEQAANKVAELMEAATDKVRETLADFDAALPVVATAGWSVIEVKIELGLPPKVVAKFGATQQLSDEQLEKLFVEHGDKRLAVLLVRTLHQAQRLQDSVHIGALKPKGIAIGIGLIPTVTVEFA